MEKIFISSTCYDLIDLRAELRELCIELGFRPLMSDYPQEGFEVKPDRDSIATCLHNVKLSDIVIVILSQRYGPTLEKHGYEPISATHLEYRTARDANKPIYMFVRTRLAVEFDVYREATRKDPSSIPTLKWTKSSDFGLFKFIDEHRPLTQGDRSNWYSEFSDSTDVKRELRFQLAGRSRKAILQQALRENAIPAIYVTSFAFRSDRHTANFILENKGTISAEDIRVRVALIQSPEHVGDFDTVPSSDFVEVESAPPQGRVGGAVDVKSPFQLPQKNSSGLGIFWVEFTGPFGHRVENLYVVKNGTGPSARTVLRRQKLLDVDCVEIC